MSTKDNSNSEKSEKSPSLILSVLNNMKQTVGTGEVEKWCRKKLASDADFLPAHITMYNLANQSGRYNDAITHVEKCLEILDDKTEGWSDMADTEPSFAAIMTEALGGEEQFETFMGEWSSTFKQGANWMVRYMPEASDYGD